MKIILKNIINNILSNKRRTAALIICMTVVGFSAMIAFSMSDSANDVLNDYITMEFGEAKIITDNPTLSESEIDLPDGCKGYYMTYASFHTQKRTTDTFIYATKRNYEIIGMDIAEAQRQTLLRYSETLSLGENEIIVTEHLAKNEKLSVGSKIEIMTADDKPITMTVKYILPNERFLKMRGSIALCNIDLAQRINCTKSWTTCNIAIPEDTSSADISAQLIEKYPQSTFTNIYDENQNTLFSILVLFMAAFAILALIIFLVAAGISEHVIRERMSQLGTLRSIGATRFTTSIILISENLFYGITGAVIGILLYLPVGGIFLNGIFIDNMDIDFSIQPLPVIIVLLVTVLISCMSALKAVVKAIKTPIRDIIFGGKDTAYVLKKGRAVFGLILVLIGIIVGCFISSTILPLISIIFVTVGGVFFLPMLANIIKRIFSRCNDPMIRLALNNIATKKTIVSSFVLYGAVMSLVCAVLITVSYIDQDFATTAYKGDIIVTDLSMKSENYRFISALDGVKNTELIYETTSDVEINGKPISIGVFVSAYNGSYDLFKGISGLPEKLAENEISLDMAYMSRFGISEGDKINVRLNAKSERPIDLEMTAAKGCDTRSNTAGVRNNIVISMELFKKYFFDYPKTMLVELDDPSNGEEMVGKINTYLMDKEAEAYTFDEYIAYTNSGSESIFTILYLIIATGSILSLIMLATNQSIGFEQRKKELAVLHSTSMSKAQLKKLLMCENLLSVLISTVWAFVFSILYYIMIMNFVNSLNDFKVPYPLDVKYAALLLTAMFAVSAVLTVINGNRVSKMNTANEMKYE